MRFPNISAVSARILRAVVLVSCLTAICASAHQVSSVSLVSRLDTEEKTYHLDIAMEVIPSEDQAQNDQISPEDAAREFAEEYLNVLFDETEVTPELEISVEKTSDEDTPETLQRKQILVNLRGTFPVGSEEFLLYLDPTCPMAVIMVVIKDEKPSRRMQVVLAGEYSRPVNIEPMVEGDPFVAAEKAKTADVPAISERPEIEAVPLEEMSSEKAPCPFCAGWSSFFAASWLPPLFLIAILLLTMKGRAVFHQLVVLLIAQGLMIALSVWQLVPPLSWALIVASVVLIILSLEAVFHHELKWWRLIVVALGGLSAGQLIASTSEFYGFFGGGVISLREVILFLLGTEVAFFAVGIVAAAILIFLSRKSWYRKAVVQPLATVITAYSLFLLLEPLL